jgi:hypothetical protein
VLFTVLCTCGEQTESLHEPDLEPWIARHVENNARVAAASALADLGQEGHE